MKYISYRISYKVLSLFIFSLFLGLFIFSGSASAASVSVSGPTTVTESSAGGTTSFMGETRSFQKVVLTIAADTPVTETGNSYLPFSFGLTGDCGLLGGKGTSELLGGPGGGSIQLHADNSPNDSAIWLYPMYDPSYTGTRTCTLTFTNNAASSANSEVASVYGSVSIPPFTLSILDTQSAPEQQPSSSTPTTTSQNPTSTSTPTTGASETSEATKPTTPTAKLVDSEGNELEAPVEGDKPIFKDSEPIVLSGTTVPNGEVKLYIFSEPQEATVTADENGVWTYTIDSIEPGDHRVEVEVTDPATGETSERAEVLAFSVAQAEAEIDEEAVATVADEPVKDDSPLLPLVLAAVLVLALGAGGGYWWRRKHKTSKRSKSQGTALETIYTDATGNDQTTTPEQE